MMKKTLPPSVDHKLTVEVCCGSKAAEEEPLGLMNKRTATTSNYGSITDGDPQDGDEGRRVRGWRLKHVWLKASGLSFLMFCF